MDSEIQRFQRDDFEYNITYVFRRVLRVFRCVLCEPLTVQSGVHKEHNGRHNGHDGNLM